MKNILAFLLLFIPSVVFSQSSVYKATSYAFALVDSKGYYTWGDWSKCNINIIIDTDNDRVYIYSKSPQVYYIYGVYNDGEPYSDSKGGRQIKFYVIDKDEDRGELRIRIDKDGDPQIYIDFKDCAWCYNINKLN